MRRSRKAGRRSSFGAGLRNQGDPARKNLFGPSGEEKCTRALGFRRKGEAEKTHRKKHAQVSRSREGQGAIIEKEENAAIKEGGKVIGHDTGLRGRN